jgi:hypothetical protein
LPGLDPRGRPGLQAIWFATGRGRCPLTPICPPSSTACGWPVSVFGRRVPTC